MRALLLNLAAAASAFLIGRTLVSERAGPTPTTPTSSPPATPTTQTSQPNRAAPSKPSTTLPKPEDRTPALPSTPERLQAALALTDPFEKARQVLAWIDTATADDFRALLKEPGKYFTVRFSGAGFNRDFHRTYLRAMAARWMEVDPEALHLIEDIVVSGRSFEVNELLVAAARLRPKLLLDQLPPDPKTDYLTNYAYAAFEALAAEDLPTARRMADALIDPVKRQSAQNRVIAGAAQRDPLLAVGMLAQLPKPDPLLNEQIVRAAESMGAGVLRQVFAAAKGQFDQLGIVPRLLLEYPDLAADLQPAADTGAKERSALLGLQARPLMLQADLTSPEQRAQLLENYDRLPAIARDDMCAALASAWARTEPRAAADWAMAHAKPDDDRAAPNRAAMSVFQRWSYNEPEAALAWWRTLPPSPLRDALGVEASTYYAEAGQVDTALEIFRPLPGQSYSGATQHLAQILAKRDPAQAAAWLGTLPPEADAGGAMTHVQNVWYAQDPKATAEWLGTIAPGKSRDKAVQGFVMNAAKDDPRSAAAWVETIEDLSVRENAAGWVMGSFKRQDPAAANEWARTVPGVSDKWRKSWIRASL